MTGISNTYFPHDDQYTLSYSSSSSSSQSSSYGSTSSATSSTASVPIARVSDSPNMPSAPAPLIMIEAREVIEMTAQSLKTLQNFHQKLVDFLQPKMTSRDSLYKTFDRQIFYDNYPRDQLMAEVAFTAHVLVTLQLVPANFTVETLTETENPISFPLDQLIRIHETTPEFTWIIESILSFCEGVDLKALSDPHQKRVQDCLADYMRLVQRIDETRDAEFTTGSSLLTHHFAMPLKLFNLTHLTSLTFTQTSITYVPAAIGQLTELTFLNLSRNCLLSLPDEIVALSKLTFLSVYRNQQMHAYSEDWVQALLKIYNPPKPNVVVIASAADVRAPAKTVAEFLGNQLGGYYCLFNNPDKLPELPRHRMAEIIDRCEEFCKSRGEKLPRDYRRLKELSLNTKHLKPFYLFSPAVLGWIQHIKAQNGQFVE